MANFLKRLRISSVDLCRRGANPMAKIALSKSREGEIGDELRARIDAALEAGGAPEDILEQLRAVLNDIAREFGIDTDELAGEDAAREHADGRAESSHRDGEIKRDNAERAGNSGGSRNNAKCDNRDCHNDDYDDGGRSHGGANGDIRCDGKNGDEGKGDSTKKKRALRVGHGLNGGNRGKARSECKKTWNAQSGHFDEAYAEYASAPMHPEVKKALDEVRNLRDGMEKTCLMDVAKKYDGVCGGAEEIAQRLDKLKSAGGGVYEEYIALMDELAEAKRVAPLMKEYGTSRSADGSLEGRVSEIMRAQPGLSRAQAVVKAYQSDPNLPEII